MFIARGGDASGPCSPRSWPPGEAWIVAYEIVEMPPTSDLEHDFWTGIASESAAAELRVTLAHDQVASQKPGAACPSDSATAGERNAFPRPSCRTGEKACGGCQSRSAQEHGLVPPATQPCRSSFLRYDDEIAEGLLRTEHELSPGPLRDIVHLTKTRAQSTKLATATRGGRTWGASAMAGFIARDRTTLLV